MNDVLDDEMEEFYEPDNPSRFFDSTFSLVNWVRTIKRGEGLSSTSINRLFKEVLLHPDFKIDDLAVKSAYDIEKYERSFYSEEDGWRTVDIGGQDLRYREPLFALETLFSSPMLAENFTLEPRDDTLHRVYSTPATGDWWRKMKVSFLNYHFVSSNVYYN